MISRHNPTSRVSQPQGRVHAAFVHCCFSFFFFFFFPRRLGHRTLPLTAARRGPFWELVTATAVALSRSDLDVGKGTWLIESWKRQPGFFWYIQSVRHRLLQNVCPNDRLTSVSACTNAACEAIFVTRLSAFGRQSRQTIPYIFLPTFVVLVLFHTVSCRERWLSHLGTSQCHDLLRSLVRPVPTSSIKQFDRFETRQQCVASESFPCCPCCPGLCWVTLRPILPETISIECRPSHHSRVGGNKLGSYVCLCV